MRVLGIDPGAHPDPKVVGMTGFALIEKIEGKPVLQEWGEIDEDSFLDWVIRWDQYKLTTVVCEDFIARPAFTGGRWTPLPVAKQVGVCMLRARQLGCTYIELQPADKPAGYLASKQKYVKGKKGTHKEDALAHACYVAVVGANKNQIRFK